MISLLTRSRALWILFILFLMETVAFGVIMQVWGFHIIDEMSDPAVIMAHIEEMTLQQRHIHAVMTATLDVAYPLTYGALFAGMSLRVFKPIFTLPSILVVPVDLAEGYVQVMALTGHMNLVWLKAYLTPLKLVLFVVAGLIALIALGQIIRHKRMRSDP